MKIVGINCPKDMQRCNEFNPQNRKCVSEKDLCDKRKGCGELSPTSNGAEVDTSRHCIKGTIYSITQKSAFFPRVLHF